MIFRELRAIHLQGNERVRVGGFLNWNAADKWRHLAGNFIQTMKGNVFPDGLDPCALQQVSQPRSAKSGIADCSPPPLNPGYGRLLKTAPIARTLERVDHRVRLKFV